MFRLVPRNAALGGLLGRRSAWLRNAKNPKRTRIQKCEPTGSARTGRSGRRSGWPSDALGQITDKTFDCPVAARLAAWRLGAPPLSGVDSILEAVWPCTGVREKGKASPGLIQALQSLPLPAFGASALRNVGDRRRKAQKTQMLRLPRFFQPTPAPPNFCLCTS